MVAVLECEATSINNSTSNKTLSHTVIKLVQISKMLESIFPQSLLYRPTNRSVLQQHATHFQQKQLNINNNDNRYLLLFYLYFLGIFTQNIQTFLF